MVLQLEGDSCPFVDSAYRLGPPRRAKSSTPRDILVKLADIKIKLKLLAVARSKGSLPYESSKILIFPDFLAETLEARQRLHLVTTTLQKSNVHYCWVAYSKILVQHKGLPLMALDLNTDAKLLEYLGIEVSPEFHCADDAPERPIWQITL